MIQQMTNRELAQEINARIGNAPIPFDSVYSIALQIYQELGGEENDFDSVYSILLEILPLAEQVAKKTSITEVDELPEANDNNNIYRLSSDNKVYMSVRYPDTITNKLPDEQQIDKACLNDSDNSYVYKGSYKVICSDGEINGYGWYSHDEDFWYMNISEVDAVHISTNDNVYIFTEEEMTNLILDEENKTITALDYTLTGLQEVWYTPLISMGLCPIPATYNAPEADCIGNATLVDLGNKESGVYTGEVITVLDGENRITGYKWTDLDNSDYCFLTIKPASEIYHNTIENTVYANTRLYYVDISDTDPEQWLVDSEIGFEQLYIPQLNAPDSEQIGKAYLTGGYYYKGEFNVQCSDGNVTMYAWLIGDDITAPDKINLTKIPANNEYASNNTISYVYADDLDYTQGYPFIFNGTVADFTVAFESDGGTTYVSGLVKYQRTIENWEWKQIPTMDDIPQPTVIKLESTGSTELAKLNDFTEIGVYNNINLQIKMNDNRYYPAILFVYRDTSIYQEIKICGYSSQTYLYEEWILRRRYINNAWQNSMFLALYNPEEI